ncbi:hypothetical protein, partial [Pseudomonas syringae]|uniref:hypothetical protein n=1 Tax=Pseudomonas syringae TaxID=317 RepID=UPI0034D67651
RMLSSSEYGEVVRNSIYLSCQNNQSNYIIFLTERNSNKGWFYTDHIMQFQTALFGNADLLWDINNRQSYSLIEVISCTSLVHFVL